MTEKRKVVISYDIRDNKRRKKISDLLLNYGFRMNFSVFECFITHFQFTEIHKNLNILINKKEDSILTIEISIFQGNNYLIKTKLLIAKTLIESIELDRGVIETSILDD